MAIAMRKTILLYFSSRNQTHSVYGVVSFFAHARTCFSFDESEYKKGQISGCHLHQSFFELLKTSLNFKPLRK